MWYLQSKRGENEINGEEVGMEGTSMMLSDYFLRNQELIKREANKFVVI